MGIKHTVVDIVCQRFGSLRALFRSVCAAYINDGCTHYFIQQQALINYIIVGSRDAPVCSFNVKGHKLNPWSWLMATKQVSQWIDSQVHSWVIRGPTVLLLFHLLWRHGSWLYNWSITTTTMSTWVCPSPVKCSVTGDSSILLYAMLKRWLIDPAM